MYKSPISIYETAMQTIMEQRENAIFARVQDAFDVQVDKKELLRALQYDRNQYEAGYIDGKADAMVEQAHGRWLERPLDNFRKIEVKCSECGWKGVENYDSYVDPSDFNFCPNCGTQMDGDLDE